MVYCFALKISLPSTSTESTIPMMTASTGASLRWGARRAELPWQNITISPMPAPTLSTAMMVLAPGRNLVGSFSSTSCGRTRSSLRPLMEGSFLVATTEPSTRARNIFVISCWLLAIGYWLLAIHFVQRAIPITTRLLRHWFPGQHSFDVRMGACDDVDTYQVALHGFDGLGAGVGGGFDRSDVADDDSGDQGVADLGHGAEQFDIGGFEHGVGALDEGDQSAGFKESDSLMRHS